MGDTSGNNRILTINKTIEGDIHPYNGFGGPDYDQQAYQSVTGWRLNVLHDAIIWRSECWTTGEVSVRYNLCEPCLSPDLLGEPDWYMRHTFDASNPPKIIEYVFESADIFIFAEKLVDGDWERVLDDTQSTNGLTSSHLQDNNRACKLEWNFQSCILTVVSQ